MEDDTKRKLLGAGKVAYGSSQVIGGCLTAAGKGILGGFLKRHDMMQSAMKIAALSIKSGGDRCKEGIEDIRD